MERTHKGAFACKIKTEKAVLKRLDDLHLIITSNCSEKSICINVCIKTNGQTAVFRTFDLHFYLEDGTLS